MAAQKHAPWQAPGRLLARARRAYRWPAARVLARARTPVASVPSEHGRTVRPRMRCLVRPSRPLKKKAKTLPKPE